MVSILSEIGMDKFATTEKLMKTTGLSDRGVRKIVASLKALGLLVRIGSDKGGHWEIVANDLVLAEILGIMRDNKGSYPC